MEENAYWLEGFFAGLTGLSNVKSDIGVSLRDLDPTDISGSYLSCINGEPDDEEDSESCKIELGEVLSLVDWIDWLNSKIVEALLKCLPQPLSHMDNFKEKVELLAWRAMEIIRIMTNDFSSPEIHYCDSVIGAYKGQMIFLRCSEQYIVLSLLFAVDEEG